jgi:hypothetical protein
VCAVTSWHRDHARKAIPAALTDRPRGRPLHCANAVFVLCSDDLSHTTGLHIPVDAGVAAAFLR